MFDETKMTVSGLQRYVRIMETVRSSDAYLSTGDRMELASGLIEGNTNPTKAAIEALCKQAEDENMEYNLARVGWLQRGGL